MHILLLQNLYHSFDIRDHRFWGLPTARYILKEFVLQDTGIHINPFKTKMVKKILTMRMCCMFLSHFAKHKRLENIP